MGLLGLELFDSASAIEAWARGGGGLGVGLLVAWLGLGFTAVPPQDRWPTTLWAVVPWYFFFASQVAYLGHLLVAVEFLVGAALLARRGQVPIGRSLVILAITRLVIFLVHNVQIS